MLKNGTAKMINQVLQTIAELKPKSLFSSIKADTSSIILTTSKEIPNLKVDKMLIETIPELKISSKELLEDRFKFVKNSDLNKLIEDIYMTLKCHVVPVELQINFYDVWGNEKQGWDVNDISSSTKWTEDLLISEFDDVILSDKEIKELIKTQYHCEDIDIEWSDCTIPLRGGADYFSFGYYFNSKIGKPLGEIFITDNEKNINNLS